LGGGVDLGVGRGVGIGVSMGVGVDLRISTEIGVELRVGMGVGVDVGVGIGVGVAVGVTSTRPLRVPTEPEPALAAVEARLDEALADRLTVSGGPAALKIDALDANS
jgi:hypothetical protein